jgi:hypothetical protein
MFIAHSRQCSLISRDQAFIYISPCPVSALMQGHQTPGSNSVQITIKGISGNIECGELNLSQSSEAI